MTGIETPQRARRQSHYGRVASIPHTAAMLTILFVLGFLLAVAGVVWIARRAEGTGPSRSNRYLHGASGTDMATPPSDSYGDSHHGSHHSDGGGWSGGDGGGGGS
jgi:hypothetical protein